jgi:hypothetical protein
MRRVSLLILAALPVLATCDSVDNITVKAEGRAVIPQRSIVDELLGQLAFTGFGSFDIEQAQEFRNQGYTKDQVDSVRMQSFTLTIADPTGADFDFLTSIRFYAEAADLPRVLIAEIDPVPVGQAQLTLEILSDVELQPYVVAPSMTITTQATGTRPPAQTTVDASASFDVDVAVSSACN